MSDHKVIRGPMGGALAHKNGAGTWHCAVCPVWLQRTTGGDIRDGVLAHYKTCHPERKTQ